MAFLAVWWKRNQKRGEATKKESSPVNRQSNRNRKPEYSYRVWNVMKDSQGVSFFFDHTVVSFQRVDDVGTWRFGHWSAFPLEISFLLFRLVPSKRLGREIEKPQRQSTSFCLVCLFFSCFFFPPSFFQGTNTRLFIVGDELGNPIKTRFIEKKTAKPQNPLGTIQLAISSQLNWFFIFKKARFKILGTKTRKTRFTRIKV